MKIGAIDIGTNSMRLLVADYVDGKFFDRQKFINTTRIGQDVDKEGFISDVAIQRNVNALKEFVNLAKNEKCEDIFVIGTSALRDSKNKDEFLKKAEVPVEIISGELEANLGFIGVCEGIVADKDILVIDIGGGSTEFIVGDKRSGIKYSRSLNIGALRMKEKFFKNDPVKDTEYAQFETFVRETIKEIMKDLTLFSIKMVVGIGGTITSLSAIHQTLEIYSMDSIHNSYLTHKDIESILNKLKKLSNQEKLKIKGLQPKRADIITAGCGILNIIMNSLNAQKIIVSEFDNLEGLICQKLKILS